MHGDGILDKWINLIIIYIVLTSLLFIIFCLWYTNIDNPNIHYRDLENEDDSGPEYN